MLLSRKRLTVAISALIWPLLTQRRDRAREGMIPNNQRKETKMLGKRKNLAVLAAVVSVAAMWGASNALAPRPWPTPSGGGLMAQP